MPISDKTRKTLWARSGNRCAICRVELVSQRNKYDKDLNLGDECHIISKSPAGPRHIPDYQYDYDDYDNLILLCKNHHRQIDELWETFTSEILRMTKLNHEKWIKDTLENDRNKQSNGDQSRFIPHIITGKEIVEIIKNVSAFNFDHCEFEDEYEAELISGFFQNIQDWGEVIGDFEIARQIKLGFELNEDIRNIESNGFQLFGNRRKVRIVGAKKEDYGLWDVANLIILRKDDPRIIDGNGIMAKISYNI